MAAALLKNLRNKKKNCDELKNFLDETKKIAAMRCAAPYNMRICPTGLSVSYVNNDIEMYVRM